MKEAREQQFPLTYAAKGIRKQEDYIVTCPCEHQAA